MTMTSKTTARRIVTSAKTWVAAAIKLGFRVVITTASDETVKIVRGLLDNAVPTEINFEILSAGESEVNNNLGFRHVLGSFKQVRIEGGSEADDLNNIKMRFNLRSVSTLCATYSNP